MKPKPKETEDDCMNKKVIITISILLVFVLLAPIPLRMKDGGTVKYQAVLYSISDVHRLAPSLASGYEEGIVIEILGMQVYNNVGNKSETVQFHDKTLNKSDLSEETLEWLAWYNGLEETEQLAISYIPHDLYELCGFNNVEDAPVETE